MSPLRVVLIKSIESYRWDLIEESADGTITALVDLTEPLENYGVPGVPEDPKQLQSLLVKYNFGSMYAVAKVDTRKHLQMSPFVHFREALNKYFISIDM